MSASVTLSFPLVTLSRIFFESMSSFTRSRMSGSLMPELLRNCWYWLSLGKLCFFWVSHEERTSLSDTLIPMSLASPSIHLSWMRNWSTWSRSLSYSCLHWALNWSAVGVGCPFAGLGAVCCLAATQAVKFGGSGTTGALVEPGGWDDRAATRSQWLNVVVWTSESPTRATELPGTLSPHADSRPASARTAPSATSERIRRATRAGDGSESPHSGRGLRHLQQGVGGPHHGGKSLARLLRHPHRDLRASRLVQRLGDALAQGPGPSRIQLDRGHSQPIAPERHRPRPRPPQLDPGLLERQQVRQRLGHRTEAILQLVAQRRQLGHLAGGADAPVDVDLGLLVRDVVGGHVGVHVDVQAHRLLAPGALAAAAHPAPDLVELGQPEGLGLLHHQRVGLRDVQARLDDAGAHQHIGVAAQELDHAQLQRPLFELAVGHREAQARAQAAQALGGLVDRLHPVV